MFKQHLQPLKGFLAGIYFEGSVLKGEVAQEGVAVVQYPCMAGMQDCNKMSELRFVPTFFPGTGNGQCEPGMLNIHKKRGTVRRKGSPRQFGV